MEPEIIEIDNTSLCQLAGKRWYHPPHWYTFEEKIGNKLPYSSGTEAAAFPLTRDDGERFYAKFFRRVKKPGLRLRRIQWLIDQKIFQWGPALSAAPQLWLDSREIGRPEDVDFDITACLSREAPGDSWLEAKEKIRNHNWTPANRQWRHAVAIELLRALALLEHRGVTHGDLSENNILINPRGSGEPLVSIIDFDAFVAANRPDLRLSVADGGTCGTDGYCPPNLIERKSTGDSSVAPYSDRYGRDMLLLELLCFNDGFMPLGNDTSPLPPQQWSNEQWAAARKILAATAACCPPELHMAAQYLARTDLLTLDESIRCSTVKLISSARLTAAGKSVAKGQSTIRSTPTPNRANAAGTVVTGRPPTTGQTASSHKSVPQIPTRASLHGTAVPAPVLAPVTPAPAAPPPARPAASAPFPQLAAAAIAPFQPPAIPSVPSATALNPTAIAQQLALQGNSPVSQAPVPAAPSVTPASPPPINSTVGCVGAFFSGCLTVIFVLMAFNVLATLITAVALNRSGAGRSLGITATGLHAIYFVCTIVCCSFLAIKLLSWSRKTVRSGKDLSQLRHDIAAAAMKLWRKIRPVLDWIVQTSRKLRLKEFLLMALAVLIVIIAAASRSSRNNK